MSVAYQPEESRDVPPILPPTPPSPQPGEKRPPTGEGCGWYGMCWVSGGGQSRPGSQLLDGLVRKSSSLKGSRHRHPLPLISHNLVGGLNLQVGTLRTVWSRAKALQQDMGQRVQASSVGGHSMRPLAKHRIVLGLSFCICKIKG